MMELSEEPYKTEQLGHLGLVASTIKRLGLIEKLNTRLPLDYKKGGKVSHGERATSMILNELGYVNRTLYLSPHFFEDKAMDVLLGKNLSSSDFNDDMLGRNLDAISKYDATKLFSEVMFEICLEQNRLTGSHHLDSTTFSLYGDYARYNECSPMPLLGYSKDHRPDLKQVTLNLVQISDAHIPIWFEALNGNSSDKTSFQKTAQALSGFQTALHNMPDNIPFMVDAAFYTPESLQQLNQVTWLTRVPASYKAAKYWLDIPDADIAWTQVDAYHKLYSFETLHEGISQRWTLVDSEKGREKSKRTFLKQLDRQYQKTRKSLGHLCSQIFNCEKDTKNLH